MQQRWRPKHRQRVTALMLTSGLLLSACDPLVGSETVRQIGEELNASLPTVSIHDTEQTKAENATFREVFFSIWPRFRP